MIPSPVQQCTRHNCRVAVEMAAFCSHVSLQGFFYSEQSCLAAYKHLTTWGSPTLFTTKAQKQMEHSVALWNIHPRAPADNDEVNDRQRDRDFAQPGETTLEFTVDFPPAAQNTGRNHESTPPSCRKHAVHQINLKLKCVEACQCVNTLYSGCSC